MQFKTFQMCRGECLAARSISSFCQGWACIQALRSRYCVSVFFDANEGTRSTLSTEQTWLPAHCSFSCHLAA